MAETPISHAFVLPDRNFFQWLNALRPYLNTFERVSVIRDPGAKNLNPYRNVSAVTAPNLWLRDDPLYHIRRIYPQVVRVDVVRASTPQQLTALMQSRIANRDRFGELQNADNHLNERFVLSWPTTHRPLRITRKMTSPPTGTQSDQLGVKIASRAGAEVIAGAAGRVTKQWAGSKDDSLKIGKYVRVQSVVQGQTYVVTYAGLQGINVPLNTQVKEGDVIGTAAGNSFTVIVQGANGLSGYRFPSLLNPLELFYITNLRLYPTAPGLRVRSIPTTQGDILTQVNPSDVLVPREMHGSVLSKLGVEGQWVRVRIPDGRTGFTAAWFVDGGTAGQTISGVNPVGVNLDAFHRLGTPDPSRLGGIGWVRMGYNVSRGSGSTDIQAAYDRYAPLARAYVRAGYKVIFVITHQTYGEAQRDFLPSWEAMNSEKWQLLSSRLADLMYRIGKQWDGSGLVHAWQIWNEQDAANGARSSVPIPVADYKNMLRMVIPAIRSADDVPQVITGGHISGASAGSAYARAATNGLSAGALPDGIAFHPYGRGSDPASPYAPFGHIEESVSNYKDVLPGKPLWITEWGVLDAPNESPIAIADYATSFVRYLKGRYGSQIAAILWYAWAQGMDNGYGLVDQNGNPRPPLTEAYLKA